MSESKEHLTLVDAIVRYIAREHGHISCLVILDDKLGRGQGAKPPRVGGFTPDVYAADAPTTTTIVGEAKTSGDLDNEHTRNQVGAFMEHLRYRTNSSFVLAVPWTAVAVARSLAIEVQRKVGAGNVDIVIIDTRAKPLAFIRGTR